MANANIPRGLVPVRHRNGAPYNGQANIYSVPASYATALYPGDPVAPVSASTDANGVPVVQLATAAGANNVLGAMISLSYGIDTTNALPVLRDSKRYRPASVAAYILVADDPELLFEIQENGNMGVGAAFRNASLVSGSGNNFTGWSGWQLNSSTLGTGVLQLRIIQPVYRSDNDPSLTNAKWLVSILQHSMLATTGV